MVNLTIIFTCINFEFSKNVYAKGELTNTHKGKPKLEMHADFQNVTV